jgi:hypothetical protein
VSQAARHEARAEPAPLHPLLALALLVSAYENRCCDSPCQPAFKGTQERRSARVRRPEALARGAAAAAAAARGRRGACDHLSNACMYLPCIRVCCSFPSRWHMFASKSRLGRLCPVLWPAVARKRPEAREANNKEGERGGKRGRAHWLSSGGARRSAGTRQRGTEHASDARNPAQERFQDSSFLRPRTKQ